MGDASRPRLTPSVVVVCAVSLGAAFLLLAADAGGASRPRAGPPPEYRDEAEAPVVAVAMKDNDYLPQTVTVNPGTVVRWDNEGRTKHNVIPDRASTGWRSRTIKPGGAFAQELDDPGVYGYFCTFHGAPGKGMYGTLIVRNADQSIPAGALRSARRAGSGKPRTIEVPRDVKRIQAAVDRAPPGSLILVSPGVYRESITVTTDRLVLRGLDRNRVILDGGYQLDNGVKVLGANGVAVENMTARRFTANGFFWTGSKGYRGSYLSATRNGDYGVYTFDSTDGLFEHLYGSGSADAAVYIGQCFPCNALVTDAIGEYNGLGFSGTNAGGNLVITDSVWRFNRAGLMSNSSDGELNPPQHGAAIVGNLVYGNSKARTPAVRSAIRVQGTGIAVGGGNDNLVRHNRVFDHDAAGIAIVPYPDTTVWLPNTNRVLDNVVSRSRVGDLIWSGGNGNCFAGNRFRTSRPSNIEAVLPCAGVPVPATDALDLEQYFDAPKPRSVDYRQAKLPKVPRLDGMRHPARAKARPAVGIVIGVDVMSISTPKLPRRVSR